MKDEEMPKFTANAKTIPITRESLERGHKGLRDKAGQENITLEEHNRRVMKNYELGETPADPRPELPMEFRQIATSAMRANMTPAQKARVKAEEIYNQYWSDVNRKNVKPSDPLPDIRPLIEKALLEFAQPVQPKVSVKAAIELRDRATQVALNFADQRISSSDGSYRLLIDLIHAELVEAARSDTFVDGHQKPYESPSDNEPNVDKDRSQYEK